MDMIYVYKTGISVEDIKAVDPTVLASFICVIGLPIQRARRMLSWSGVVGSTAGKAL